MAIITKPTIAKGQANEFDLSKSDLAVLSKVTSDSYFSDQANWSKVYIEYKSTEGKQHEMVIFDALETAPKGSFDISEKSKDSWEVQALVIMDFDGGYLKLERGDLTVADFDIAISSGDLGQDIAAIYTAFDYLNVLRGDPDNALDSYDYFGWSVAVSGDYIVVGAYEDDGDGNATSGSGAAYVYKINQDDTIKLLDTLRGDPDPDKPLDSNDRFGYSVAISGDYIVVSAYLEDGDSNSTYDSGAAYVYKINQNDTIELLGILRGDPDPDKPLGSYDNFGHSVAVSGDYIVVGADRDGGANDAVTSSGAAYVYKINQNDTIELLGILRGDPDPDKPLDSNDRFGYSVAISGSYIVVGADRDGGLNNAGYRSGAAYVYKINQDDTIALLDTLRGDPDNSLDNSDYFGYSVAVSGNYIVVGAYYDDGVNNAVPSSGAAYVYKINQDDTIAFLATLRGDPNNPLDNSDIFGRSVAVSGDYIVVGGVPGRSVYIYKIDSDNIELLNVLLNMISNSNFGNSVAISGDYIVVGAPRDNNFAGLIEIYKGSLLQVSDGSVSVTGINRNYLNSTYLRLYYGADYVEQNNTQGRSTPVYLSEGIDFSGGGKYYKEITVDKQSNLYTGQFGFRIFGTEPTDLSLQGEAWGFQNYKDSSADIAVRGSDGVLFHTVNGGNASATNPFSPTFGAGDTLGIAIDLDNFKFYFSVNGVWANNANPETGVGGIDISASGSYFNGSQNMNVLFFAGLMQFKTSVQVVQEPLYKPQGYSDC